MVFHWVGIIPDRICSFLFLFLKNKYISTCFFHTYYIKLLYIQSYFNFITQAFRDNKITFSTCGIFRRGFNSLRTTRKLSILHPLRNFQIVAVRPLPFSVQTSLVTSLTASTPIIYYTDTGNNCWNDFCRYRHNSCPHISLGYKLNWLLHLFKVY